MKKNQRRVNIEILDSKGKVKHIESRLMTLQPDGHTIIHGGINLKSDEMVRLPFVFEL